MDKDLAIIVCGLIVILSATMVNANNDQGNKTTIRTVNITAVYVSNTTEVTTNFVVEAYRRIKGIEPATFLDGKTLNETREYFGLSPLRNPTTGLIPVYRTDQWREVCSLTDQYGTPLLNLLLGGTLFSTPLADAKSNLVGYKDTFIGYAGKVGNKIVYKSLIIDPYWSNPPVETKTVLI